MQNLLEKCHIFQDHLSFLPTENVQPTQKTAIARLSSILNKLTTRTSTVITRPCTIKSHIPRPSLRQRHITLTIEHYIGHITRVNNHKDTCQTTTGDQPTQPPDLHDFSTSDPGTSFPSTGTQSSYSSRDDSDSTTHSTFLSTSTSSMHLQPRVLISSNETFLSKKHGCPQIRIMNTLSIPLLAKTDLEEKS